MCVPGGIAWTIALVMTPVSTPSTSIIAPDGDDDMRIAPVGPLAVGCVVGTVVACVVGDVVGTVVTGVVWVGLVVTGVVGVIVGVPVPFRSNTSGIFVSWSGCIVTGAV
jgi:hypothetical protein